MRKLATIRKISSIQPIKGKDRVELAIIDGWTCMVSKAQEFKPDDLCVFCEPDSVFPAIEQWEFIKKYNYRIKTQKFKDSDGNPIYSQGLVLSLSSLPQKPDWNGHPEMYLKVGDDVTESLGITQYEPPMDIDRQSSSDNKDNWFINILKKSPLMKWEWFRNMLLPKKKDLKFPSFISKTDEERIQNCPEIVNIANPWIATEKIDGQSGTWCVRRIKRKILYDKYEFIVCSRNFRTYGKDTSYWKIAEKYQIKEALIKYLKIFKNNDWVCIQGEIIGPKIQGNKYKVEQGNLDMYVFNFITSSEGRYDSLRAEVSVENLGMHFVPIIDENVNLVGFDVQQILKVANGKSLIADTMREGIVFRSTDGDYSFKAVSPEFLIKNNE